MNHKIWQVRQRINRYEVVRTRSLKALVRENYIKCLERLIENLRQTSSETRDESGRSVYGLPAVIFADIVQSKSEDYDFVEMLCFIDKRDAIRYLELLGEDL